MKLIEGQLIHRRYRLDARLAQGGMGEVWKGYDIQLGRPVAIKALRGDLGVTQEAKLLRLRAEEIKVGLFGQELAGEHVGQVLAFNVDRHGRIDQPVRAACADKMAGFEHGLQPILVTLDAAAARFRIGAMEFLAGVLPIVADDFGAIDIGDGEGYAHDPAEVLDQELQSRNVDEVGELDSIGVTHDDSPESEGVLHSCTAKGANQASRVGGPSGLAAMPKPR